MRKAPTLAASVLALGFLAALTAAPAGAQDSVPEEIADSLEGAPVHVDPAYGSAFPEEARREVADSIRAADLSLYVIVVPLADGDAWDGDPGTLATLVHDRGGGGEGHYLVFDNGGMHGQDFGSDTGSPAHFGALTSSYATDFSGDLRTRVEIAVDTALSDDPEGAYDAAMADYEERRPEQAPGEGPREEEEDAAGAAPGWLWPSVAALALTLAAGLSWRSLRARRSAAPVLRVAQHAAFDNAGQAHLESLVARGAEDLIDLGERLSGLRSETKGEEGTRLKQRALEARSAAAKVHDRMRATEPALPDAVGVLVLLDHAEDAFAMSRSKSAKPRVHCYANPLHGTETRKVEWREFGGTRSITVPLCAACARAVRDRRRPTVLPARHRGAEIPYYEVPAAESVWAATGYGALREDLVQRILRGDHAREPR